MHTKNPSQNQEFSLTQQGAALDDDDSDKWSQIASAGSEAPDDLESDFEETDSAYFSCEEGETGSDASSLDSGDGFERFNSSSENPSDSEFDPEDAVRHIILLVPCMLLISFSWESSEPVYPVAAWMQSQTHSF